MTMSVRSSIYQPFMFEYQTGSEQCVCVCIRFQQFFSHITTVSGCDRELNAHFYSAASLKYHVPDT